MCLKNTTTVIFNSTQNNCRASLWRRDFSAYFQPGWKYAEKSLLHSDDRQLFRTLILMVYYGSCENIVNSGHLYLRAWNNCRSSLWRRDSSAAFSSLEEWFLSIELSNSLETLSGIIPQGWKLLNIYHIPSVMTEISGSVDKCILYLHFRSDCMIVHVCVVNLNIVYIIWRSGKNLQFCP